MSSERKWIIQLGTPESLDKEDVGRYLTHFLMDPGTISIPYPLRWYLVHRKIVPKRTLKVIERYKQIWHPKKGSPLQYHSEDLVQQLNQKSTEKDFRLGMLFGKPGIEELVREALEHRVSKIKVLPLFPHETPATTAAARRIIKSACTKQGIEAEISWIPPFYLKPGFLSYYVGQIKSRMSTNPDCIVFSFHGLPMKQIQYPNQQQPSNYMEACFNTVNQIIRPLSLKDDQFRISFQSRFGKNWTGPQTADILSELAKSNKSVLVLSPSFTTDCLETSWEIGISFKETFLAEGGKAFDWIPSPNSDENWVNTIFDWMQKG